MPFIGGPDDQGAAEKNAYLCRCEGALGGEACRAGVLSPLRVHDRAIFDDVNNATTTPPPGTTTTQ